MAQGHQFFAAELTLLAAEMGDPRMVALCHGIATDVAAPLRIAVSGRRGVGRRTVAEALAGAGLNVCAGTDPELEVYVVAETVKPEDARAVRAAARRHPVLAVLNKADLPGRCGVAEVAMAARVPAESMSALLALAARDELDDRLRAALDLPGIERAVGLARSGRSAVQARAALRRLSGVDRVVARVAALGAGAYHRRMTTAISRLEALAVGGDPEGRIDEFLTREDTAAARMAAAMAAVGEWCEPGESALRRARRWQAYRGAPLSGAMRACAADIATGSLRAWAGAGDRSGGRR